MNRVIIYSIIFIVVSCLTSCIIVPGKSKFKDSSCKLVTNELELGLSGSSKPYPQAVKEAGQGSFPSGCNSDNEIIALVCLAEFIGKVVVPAASFVVSGSIVVVGNTIHWIEKTGKM